MLPSTGSRAQASVVAAHGHILCSTWDLPRLEIEPMAPTLAGRFFTTDPPGKSLPEMFGDSLNVPTAGEL